MKEIKISVIIPFYGVAAYVERCTRSLMEQTLEDVEFIFVDDASPDDSRDIIERVSARYGRNVKLLTHPENKGLPASRNTGLAAAKGEFIYHCDSDDYLEPTMLEDMYEAALTSDADFAYCDFYLDYGTGRRYMANPTYDNTEQMVKEGFLAGLMKYNVWNKLARRSLYEGITFPAGHGMGEDMTIIPMATRAQRVVHVPKALYHYMRINGNAFTNTVSEKHRTDMLFNTERTVSLLNDWPVKELDMYLAFFKLGIKLPLLLTGSFQDYRLWHQWFPEANRYVPQNKHLPRRTIWLQQWAAWHLFPLVWLYSVAVTRIYYGLIQKGK